jgi:hypothetical protein
MIASCCGRLSSARAKPFGAMLSVQPIVHVFSHQILGQAVALLDFAFQLIATAIDLRQIVVGELTPLFFDFAFNFFPVSFDPIPIDFDASKSMRAREHD